MSIEPGDRPLGGLFVLSFGWVWAGSVAGHMLADFGATVVRVEWPARPDLIRTVGPTLKGVASESFYAHQTYRNQLSCAIDVGSEQGRALVRDLARRADVLLENMRPGTAARLGLGYDELAATNPGLVMLSMSGFGQSGPYRDLPSYGNITASFAGYEGLHGYPEDDTPVPVNQAITDPLNGVLAATLILGAIYRREATGRGDYIELSQFEQAVDLIGPELLDFQMNGRVSGVQGNADPLAEPSDVFPCAGTDAWIAIAITGDAEWQSLLDVLAVPMDARPPDLATGFGRWQDRGRTAELVALHTRARDAGRLAAALQEAGVAAYAALGPAHVFADPHLAARSTWVTVDHALGPEVISGVPAKLSRTPGAVTRACPAIGADTRDVLRVHLGLDDAAIGALAASGVIHQA